MTPPSAPTCAKTATRFLHHRIQQAARTDLEPPAAGLEAMLARDGRSTITTATFRAQARSIVVRPGPEAKKQAYRATLVRSRVFRSSPVSCCSRKALTRCSCRTLRTGRLFQLGLARHEAASMPVLHRALVPRALRSTTKH